MKKTIAALVIGVPLLLFYLIWPPSGLYEIALAVQAKDTAQLVQRIDLQQIRQSLATQIVSTYFEIAGKKTNTLLGQIMIGEATAIADALLAKLLTPDAIIDLLGRGDIHTVAPKFVSNTQVLSPAMFDNVWGVLKNSDYALARYHIRVPFDRPRADQFRFQLRLRGGRWRLIEVELPQQLKRELAQSLVDSDTEHTESSAP